MKKLSLLFIISLACAQWSSNPDSPQLLGSGVQAQVKATSDGGVYIAWITDISDGDEILNDGNNVLIISPSIGETVDDC